MFQTLLKNRKLLLSGLMLALGTAALPAKAQPVIPDPDTANAPIPDRETFGLRPKQSAQAPDLAAIGVRRTGYPIPLGAVFASPQGNADVFGYSRKAPTTLAHALQTAPVGGTIVLRGGDYRGVGGLKIPHQMTFQAAPNEVVWIKGSAVVSGFARDGANYSVAWDKKLTHPNALDLDKNNPIAGDTDMVFMAGRAVKQVATLAEVKPGTFFVDTAAKKLVLGDNPTGQLVEATTDVSGLDLQGREGDGTTIRGLGFAHFAEYALQAFTRRLLLENCTFAWNAVRGFSLHDPDNVIRGNTFACNGLSGMQSVFADNLIFENNHVLFNNIEGFRATWSASGTKMVLARNMTLRNNLYENNQAAAMWFDISAINTSVIGNIMRHNKGLGVFYELCHRGIVAFNVIEDNGVGLMLSDSSSVRAWNNTFIDNAKAITVKDSPRVNIVAVDEGFYSNTRKAEDIAAGVTWIATDNEFHNNLFVGGRNDKSVLFDGAAPAKGKTSSDMIAASDHNVYARTAPDLPRLLVRWQAGTKPEDFDSLETFRAANASYEANAMLLNTSPLTGADHYHLAPNSPLLKAGTALPEDVKAAIGAAGITFPAQEMSIGALGASSTAIIASGMFSTRNAARSGGAR